MTKSLVSSSNKLIKKYLQFTMSYIRYLKNRKGRLGTDSCVRVERKAKMTSNRYNEVPYLNRNTIWKSDRNTRKHNTQMSQEVSPFSACDHKATRNRQDSITINMKHK